MCPAVNPEVEKLIQDAKDLLKKARAELEVNIRDAAENAWEATVRATDAVILERRGFVPTGPTAMPDRRRALHEIHGKEPIIRKREILERFYIREGMLHGSCFCEGICDPIDEVKRRIVETRDYIEDVRKLTH